MRNLPEPGGGAIRLGLVIGQLTAGGAEGQLWELCRGLVRQATFEPAVYCLSERSEPYGPLIRGAGVPVHVISGSPLVRAGRLRRRLDGDRVELIHAWLFIANAYAWLANLGSARPLLTSARNCKRQGILLDVLNRYAFAGSTAVVANSKEVAEYAVREYRAPRDRISVIPNAIDTERFRPATKVTHEGLGVVMVGRLVPQKNPRLFVSAAAEVRRQMPAGTRIRFILIGDGPLRAELEAEIRSAGLGDCCSLLGERRDVPELLRDSDLFWLTSDWEGSPNVVLEAMASGLPVIVTDVGGAGELVRQGQDGFVVRAGDCSALVTHSLALIADAEKRVRFGRSARHRAEEFTPQRMVRAMQDVYSGVFRGRQT